MCGVALFKVLKRLNPLKSGRFVLLCIMYGEKGNERQG